MSYTYIREAIIKIKIRGYCFVLFISSFLNYAMFVASLLSQGQRNTVDHVKMNMVRDDSAQKKKEMPKLKSAV